MPLQWHTSHVLECVTLLTTFTRCPLLSEAVLVDTTAPQGSAPGVWPQLRPSSLPGRAPGWVQMWGTATHPCSPQPRVPCRAPQPCTAASVWAHEVCPSLPLCPHGCCYVTSGTLYFLLIDQEKQPEESLSPARGQEMEGLVCGGAEHCMEELGAVPLCPAWG